MEFAGGQQIEQVVHEPRLARAKGWRAAAGTGEIEPGTVRHAQFAHKAVGDGPRHGAPLTARNLVVAMMVARRIDQAFAFEETQIKRVLPQDPVHLVHGKNQRRRLMGELIHKRRGPRPAQNLKVVSKVCGEELVRFAAGLTAQTERIVCLADTEVNVFFKGPGNGRIERIISKSQCE